MLRFSSICESGEHSEKDTFVCEFNLLFCGTETSTVAMETKAWRSVEAAGLYKPFQATLMQPIGEPAAKQVTLKLAFSF